MTSLSRRTSGALAYAIEKIERDAWLDLFASARDVYQTPAQPACAQMDCAALLADRSVPIAEMNRAFCLGLQAPVTEEVLDAVIAWLDGHAAPAWVIQLSPLARPAGADRWLSQRNLRKTGTGWAKFHRGPAAELTSQVTTSLEIRPVDGGLAQDFGHVVQAGFGLPVHTKAWFASLPARRGWHCYLAFKADRPVAAASMYLSAGWGWLGIDATLADARGQGAQSALIARRLHDGMLHDLSGLTAETAAPPEHGASENASFRNYRRAGFALAYVRQNYGRLK